MVGSYGSTATVTISSTYHSPRCHSSQCSIANSHWRRSCFSSARPGCNNNTCGLVSFNPVTHRSGSGELAQDVLSVQSISHGSNLGPPVIVPNFLFACPLAFLLQQTDHILPQGVLGFAGLGPNTIALPTQLAFHAGLQHKFALCLGTYNGVMFFGSGPYPMLPGIDISKSLACTPLIISPQGEYYIGVAAIKVNDKNILFNASLLSIDRHWLGGTKISTVAPYTILEDGIFKVVTKFYTNEFSSVLRVAAIAPFGLCFNSTYVGSSRMGPGIPYIDLVLQKNNVGWRIFGENVVVRVGNKALCLAFVNGGARPRASIVIGGHQLEDNLAQFDLASSRLGFSSSLLFRRNNCGNFNFTPWGMLN